MLPDTAMQHLQGLYGHRAGFSFTPPGVKTIATVEEKVPIVPGLQLMTDVVDDIINRSDGLRATGKYQLLIADDVFPTSGWSRYCHQLVDYICKRGYTVYVANSVQLKDVGSIWMVADHGHLKNDGQYRTFQLANKKTPTATVGNVDLVDLFKGVDALLAKSAQFKRLGVQVLKKVDLNDETRDLFEQHIPELSEHLLDNGYKAAHYTESPTRLWVYINPATPIHQKDKKTIYMPASSSPPVNLVEVEEQLIAAEKESMAALNTKLKMLELSHQAESDRQKKRIAELETANAQLKPSNGAGSNDDINTLIKPSVGAGVAAEVEYDFVDDIQKDDLNERVADGWEVVSLTPMPRNASVIYDGQPTITMIEVFGIFRRVKK